MDTEGLQVKKGENIAVTYGKKKEIVAYISPEPPERPKRRAGILEGKATFTFSDDFKMTTEEFLNS